MKTACAGVMVLLVLAAAMGAESRSVAGEVQEVASNKLNTGRQLRMLIQELLKNANGFEIGAGVKLEAEVDDITSSLDLGPFKFTLDDIPSDEKKEVKKKETKATCPLEQCDTYTGHVFCCYHPHHCFPTGKIITNCGH